MKDVLLTTTKALPAAAATATSDSIDLNLAPSAGQVNAACRLVLTLPAVPALVDTKTITYTVYDSADNSSFAAVSAIPAQVQTGASSAGAAAAVVSFQIPPTLRRYVRFTAAVLTGGGDNTAKSATLTVEI